MKRRVCLLLSIVFVMLSVFSVCSCTKVQEPEPRKYKCSVRYLTGEGGYIEGETYQELTQGEDATPVKFIANEGYVFLEWSDGNTSAERHDLAVEHDLQVTAKYRKISDTAIIIDLDYMWGNVDGLPGIGEVIFDMLDFKEQMFPVPRREHFTFGGWYIGDKMIADADGKMTVGKEMFTNYHGYDYKARAKWIANETFDYKILLVYFEDVTVEYTSRETGEKRVEHYIMTEEQRDFYHELTLDIKKTMDDLLEGIVDFRIDEYFVSSPQYAGENLKDYKSLYGYDISELKNIANGYKAVVSMTDFPVYLLDYKEKNWAGHATGKYADIFIERNKNMEDGIYYHTLRDTFMHEFSHIIEDEIRLPELHEIAHSNPKLYLTHRAYKDFECAGVPYEYWAEQIYTVKYGIDVNHFPHKCDIRFIMNRYGDGCSRIPFKKTYGSVIQVIAVAEAEYRFVGWSDGVTTPERTDIITGDFEVEALFEKIS